MLTPRIAWGLDIGESSLKAVKLRRTKAGAEIISFDTIERTAPADDTGDKDYHLREALNKLVQRNKIGKNTPVVVSIQEPAFSRFIPLPPGVSKSRIPQVAQYEARQQIPFPIEEVVWDYQPVREAMDAAEETEVAIFSLRSQFVYALLQNLALCKIRPVGVLPIPLALYNYLTFDRDVAKGTIVIDVGASSTDIIICDPDNFRVRNITVSGNGLARALADRLKITPAEAEALKRECKDEVQAARLFKLIQPSLTDLVGQVQRTIGFFKSQIHNVRIEQALLLGNTFRLPGVSEFLIHQMGVDMLPADDLDRITLAPNVDSAALKQSLPALGCAIGLALRGLEIGRVQVNLMPKDLRLQRELNQKKPYVLASAACLGIIFGVHYYALKAKVEEADTLLAKYKNAETLITKLTTDETSYNDAAGKIGATMNNLQMPLRLSVGHPEQSIGYRGCLTASDELNKVLNKVDLAKLTIKEIRMSPDVIVKENKMKLPVMKIRIVAKAENIDSFVEQLRDRLIEHTIELPSGEQKKVFDNIAIDGVPKELENGVEAVLVCDFMVPTVN